MLRLRSIVFLGIVVCCLQTSLPALAAEAVPADASLADRELFRPAETTFDDTQNFAVEVGRRTDIPDGSGRSLRAETLDNDDGPRNPSAQSSRGQVADAALFVPHPIGDAIARASFVDVCRDGFAVGEFHVVPYGAFWSDALYETSRTNPGAFTLWVFSDKTHGEPAFVIDARRTRFGINIDGPAIPALSNADSSARLEIDFHGDFVTENRASVLLRHAYWEVRNEDHRFLVGQHWDVISPLLPGALNYSVGWAAGNIGFRRAQIRYERYLYPADSLQLALQTSLNQDIVTDFPTDVGVRREPASWPVVEGRFGVTFSEQDGGDLLKFGVSAHIGETGFDFLVPGPPPLSLPPEDDARFRTWSFNVDLWAPLTARTGLQGEFFMGSNLSAVLGGIGQGVCPCLRRPIRSMGGWIDIWHNWSPCCRSHVGYGLDDPRNNDSLFGRTYNQFLFANVSYDVTNHLTMGLEATWWTTLYQEKRAGQIPDDQLMPNAPGEAVVLQWMFKYGF